MANSVAPNRRLNMNCPIWNCIVAIVHGLVYRAGEELISITVDSRYLEFQGTHGNTSRYPYLDISKLRE